MVRVRFPSFLHCVCVKIGSEQYTLHEKLRICRGGVTLLECIVVVAIIGILVSLLFPTVHFARESMRTMACTSNIRQLAMANLNFESAMHRLPAGTNCQGYSVPWDQFRNNANSAVFWKQFQHASFIALVLPHLEQSSLYSSTDPVFFDLERTIPKDTYIWFGEIRGFRELAANRMSIVECPSDFVTVESIEWTGGSQPALDPDETTDAFSYIEFMSSIYEGSLQPTNYLACAGAYSGGIHPDPGRMRFRGAMSSKSRVMLNNVRDGTSNTIMIGETIGEHLDRVRKYMQPWSIGGLARARGVVPWNVEPLPDESLLGDYYNSSAFGFGSKHSLVNFAFTDGSVRSIDRQIYWRLLYSLSGMADAD
jgi:prepilin-type N-terminal cleavage/methylation domain-containing protein